MSQQSYAGYGWFVEVNEENMSRMEVLEEWKALWNHLKNEEHEMQCLENDDLEDDKALGLIAAFFGALQEKLKVEAEFIWVRDNYEGFSHLERRKLYLMFDDSQLFDMTPKPVMKKIQPFHDSFSAY